MTYTTIPLVIVVTLLWFWMVLGYGGVKVYLVCNEGEHVVKTQLRHNTYKLTCIKDPPEELILMPRLRRDTLPNYATSL